MSLRFRSQIQIDNLPDEMTDNKWEVILPSLNLETIAGGIPYIPIVEEVVFRGTSFENEEFRIGTRFYNLPSDRASFGTCAMTLFCEQGMLPVYYLQQWRNLIFNPKHQFYYCNARNGGTNKAKGLDLLSTNFGSSSLTGLTREQINSTTNWKKDIQIFFYGLGTATPIAQATLYNAYPISQGDYSLQYSMEPKRFRINVTFRYDNVIWSSRYKELAILSSALAGNPIGTVADQLAAQASSGLTNLLGNDNNDYLNAI